MNSKINILYFINSLNVGGAERCLVSLIKKINRQKFNVIVCCMRKTGELISEVEKLGIPVITLGYRPFNPVSIYRLSNIIREVKADIVHTQLYEADIIGRLAAKIAQVPVVISSIQNIHWWKSDHKLAPRIKAAIDRITVNYCTAKVIAVSDAVKEFHIKQVGYNSRKVTVLYNTINLDEFTLPGNLDPKRKKETDFELQPETPVIINVASLTPQKGQVYILQAVPKVLKAIPDTHFLIVGQGRLNPELQAIARETGISNNVIFTGLRSDIAELLAMSDIFVLPSLWEGLSVAVLEAMAMKKPVVATNIAGMSELVINGETGVLVPIRDADALADAIINLLRYKQKAQRFGDAGRKRVTKFFSDDVVVTKLENLYEQLLTQKRRKML